MMEKSENNESVDTREDGKSKATREDGQSKGNSVAAESSSGSQTVPEKGDGSNNTLAPSDLSTKSRDEQPQGLSSVVADHYNTLQEKGLDERMKSRIIYLRNFNNWVKSMLINEYLSKIKQSRSGSSGIQVLDIGCGKGGDLLKWRRGNISHLICADLAATSMEQCQNRYRDLHNRSRYERGFASVFSAEFITADCTKVRLRDRYKDPSIQLDLVSCQFAFHYCFESLAQAECMLRNASECLRPGGYFIGTIPDAYTIVDRWKKADKKPFGNDLYKVEFMEEFKSDLPLFGAKYNFHLEGVVDCPEFLVHFPTLVKLAKKFDLQLVSREQFQSFYEHRINEGRSLLGKMQALETYPPFHEAPLLSYVKDYEHAAQHMQQSTGHRKVGTLSKSDWEATTIYLTFAFQKCNPK